MVPTPQRVVLARWVNHKKVNRENSRVSRVVLNNTSTKGTTVAAPTGGHGGGGGAGGTHPA